MTASLRPRVLNTRARHQAEALSRLLREAGFEPVEAPTVELRAGWGRDDAALVLGRLRAGVYDWAVLASANAAELLVDGLRAAGAADADLRGLRVVSGPGTARQLESLGVPVELVLDRFSASAALAALAERPIGGAVLAPRAAEGRDELIRGLAARGVRVDAPVLYETLPVPPGTLAPVAAALRAGALAGVIFSSPSTVRGLVDGLRALGENPLDLLAAPTLACIGDTTAAAVRAHGLPEPVVAETTSLEALVAAAGRALLAAPAEVVR
jgi:uroporphyrinogen-III synthase